MVDKCCWYEEKIQPKLSNINAVTLLYKTGLILH